MEEKTGKNNVKCTACGNETFCEPCQKEPGGQFSHLCFECYQKQGGKVEDQEKTHVCIPPEKLAAAYDQFLSDATHRAFTDLWAADKKKLKVLSKQKLAQTSFFEGARFMLGLMRRMSAESEKRNEKK